MDQIDEKISFVNPIIIVIVYLVIGTVWILFFDSFFALFVKDISTLAILHSFKEIIFLFVTSLVIFYLVNHGFNKIKSSQKIMTENERKHTIILDTVGDIIIYVDKYGKILDVNKRVETKLGYRKEELLGKSFMDIGVIDVKYIPALAKMFRQGISNKSADKIELELKHKDGSIIVVEANNKFIIKNGEVMGAVTAFRDITERKKALIQIENNIENFAHLIDHIRNPLAILKAFTQVKINDTDIKQNLSTQIDTINEIINELDEGWMNTEDTRKFLKNYK